MQSIPRIDLFEKFRTVIEAAFLSLLAFRLMTLLFVEIFPTKHIIFYISILFAHYTTVLLCGFWCGWRIRIDGWLYGLVAFAAFYALRQIFDISYPLEPIGTTFRILLIVPLLALLLIGSVYGEIAAEKKEQERKDNSLRTKKTMGDNIE